MESERGAKPGQTSGSREVSHLRRDSEPPVPSVREESAIIRTPTTTGAEEELSPLDEHEGSVNVNDGSTLEGALVDTTSVVSDGATTQSMPLDIVSVDDTTVSTTQQRPGAVAVAGPTTHAESPHNAAVPTIASNETGTVLIQAELVESSDQVLQERVSELQETVAKLEHEREHRLGVSVVAEMAEALGESGDDTVDDEDISSSSQGGKYPSWKKHRTSFLLVLFGVIVGGLGGVVGGFACVGVVWAIRVFVRRRRRTT